MISTQPARARHCETTARKRLLRLVLDMYSDWKLCVLQINLGKLGPKTLEEGREFLTRYILEQMPRQKLYMALDNYQKIDIFKFISLNLSKQNHDNISKTRRGGRTPKRRATRSRGESDSRAV